MGVEVLKFSTFTPMFAVTFFIALGRKSKFWTLTCMSIGLFSFSLFYSLDSVETLIILPPVLALYDFIKILIA